MSEEQKPFEQEPVEPPLGLGGADRPVQIDQPESGDFSNTYERFADSASRQMNEAADAIRRGEFISDSVVDPSADADDKLVGLLAYLVPVLLPIIVLLSEASQKRPFQRYHAVQSLGLTGGLILISLALGLAGAIVGIIPVINVVFSILMFCITPILIIMGIVAMVYYGLQAYKGNRFAIPVVTAFLSNQGWI